MSLSKDEIVREAKRYIGVKWKHCGRSKQGLDCVGLYWIVLDNLGYDVANDLKVYNRIPQGNELIDELDKRLTRKDFNDIEPGDLMVLRVRALITHVGIYDFDKKLNRAMIVHADNTRGVVYHGLSYWKNRVEAVFEI